MEIIKNPATDKFNFIVDFQTLMKSYPQRVLESLAEIFASQLFNDSNFTSILSHMINTREIANRAAGVIANKIIDDLNDVLNERLSELLFNKSEE